MATSVACFAYWLGSYNIVKRWCCLKFGATVDFTGTPKWSNCTKLWSQLVVFPTLFFLSFRSNDSDLRAWSQTAGLSLASEHRLYDVALASVFAGYMLEDFVMQKLNKQMVMHHCGCLTGIIIAFFLLPTSFPYFALGVIIFEFGSAALNLFCINSENKTVFVVYALGMTLSNIGALTSCLMWISGQPFHAQIVGLVLTVSFALMRQMDVATIYAESRRL